MAHLTLQQRYKIEFCISENKTYSQIGDYIDRDKSVVSREIKRNSDARNGNYKAELADLKARKRHLGKAKKRYFTDGINTYVRKYLKLDYSPEQIRKRAALEGIP